jgi:hypothetical protein
VSRRTILTLFVIACAFASSTAQSQVRVGPTVNVSSDAPTLAHTEYFAAVDRQRPDRMVICSMAIDPAHNRLTSVVYRTESGGSTWRLVFADTVSQFGEAWDPTCGFGADGTAYLSSLALPPLQAVNALRNVTTLHKSSDGGAHWSGPQSLPLLHNPYLTIDQNSRNYGGRIYIVGRRDLPDSAGRGAASAPSVIYSTDGSASFRGPVDFIDTANTAAYPGAAVVRDDGTLLVPLTLFRRSASGSPGTTSAGTTTHVAVVPLVGGGTAFGPASVVATIQTCTDAGIGPVLAIDRTNGPYRGRVYTAYNDRTAGHCQVLLAHSDDGGSSWSPPTRIDDPPIPVEPGKGPDTFMPQVAVNSAGVVGVTWYDRREDPLNRRFQLRFAASTDGGASFMGSVPVSSTDSLYSGNERYFGVADPVGGGQRGQRRRTDSITVTMNTGGPYRTYYFAGDYGAIATTPDGRFHAIWVDSRTGVPQLYTAPITVAGSASRRGDAAVDSLTNVSSAIEATILSSSYDHVRHRVRMSLQLRNTSERALALPLLVQLRSLASHLGTPRLVGATGNPTVVINSVPGERSSLRPGEVSGPTELEFEFDSFVPLMGRRHPRWIATLVRFTVIVNGRYLR